MTGHFYFFFLFFQKKKKTHNNKSLNKVFCSYYCNGSKGLVELGCCYKRWEEEKEEEGKKVILKMDVSTFNFLTKKK